MTPAGRSGLMRCFATCSRYANDGTACWLDRDGPGPYDGAREPR